MYDAPAFWRVFGPGLLGSAGLLLLTLFNSLNADLASLRREVAREREARLALVTRSDADTALADAEARLDAFARPAPRDLPSETGEPELWVGCLAGDEAGCPG